MKGARLSNYLKTHRKRSGLSQKEVAFLLGTKNVGHLCRLERNQSQRTLTTAIAFQVLYRQTFRDLFAGLFVSVQGEVARRAKRLHRQIQAQPDVPGKEAKLRFLEHLEVLARKEK